MNTAKLIYILKINELINSAIKSSSEIPNNLCDLMVNEFDFAAAAIFKVRPNFNFELIGKSSTVKKNLESNTIFECTDCNVVKQDIKFSFYPTNFCKKYLTERPLFESCALIKLNDGTDLLLKVSKTNEFIKSQIDEINDLLTFFKIILDLWILGKGSITNSVSKIISSYAKELRTPLNSLLGLITLLNEEPLSPIQNNYIIALKENNLNLLSLFNDLIDLSEIESGVIKIQFKSVNFKDFISNIIKGITSQSINKEVDIIYNIDNALAGTIEIDSQKVKYILQTLLTNSMKLVERGRISLSVKPITDKRIEFSLIDTSAGLSSKKLLEFFNPFSLQESYIHKSGNISGLSLYLAKKYIEILGGNIDVSCNPNKGNNIKFSINAVIDKTIESQLEQIPLPTPSRNRVLVIEDDYATSKLLSNYLIKWGYDPLIINSYKQVFNLIDKEVFLAILIDVNLPEISSFELIKQLRTYQNIRHTPIIILSVEAEEQKAFLMSSVEYLQKPINYRNLVETLMSYKLKKESIILVVDDDIPTLNLLKNTIEQVGFNTIAFSDPTKVINYIENSPPDLAIIDLDMPVLNGFELIKLIKTKKQFLNLPIIIYTGKDSIQDELKKIDGMFTELLHKSSTKIEDLADTVAALINKVNEPKKPEEVKLSKDSVKILLVEDYKHSQIIVTRLLKKNNFESVVVVENGLQALEAVKQQKFDLILMDMQMPVMNGFEATQKIREIPEYKEVPIIALTAFAMKGDRERCLEAGANDYIPKPIDSQEFIEKVKFHTEKRFIYK